jgi:PKD repeat protein
MTYYTQFAKAALASFAHMGCLLGDLGGTVRDGVTGSSLASVNVETRLNGALDEAGQTAADGGYQHLLKPASYSVKFWAPEYRTETVNNVQVVAGEHTTLDRSLQPCDTVDQVSFVATPSQSPVGQHITFSASVAGGAAPVSLSWDFADGSSGSGAEVTHSYSAPGVYVVRLTADNSCLLPVTARKGVLVGENFSFLPIQFR